MEKYLAEDGKGYSVGLVKGKLNGENDYGQIAQIFRNRC